MHHSHGGCDPSSSSICPKARAIGVIQDALYLPHVSIAPSLGIRCKGTVASELKTLTTLLTTFLSMGGLSDGGRGTAEPVACGNLRPLALLDPQRTVAFHVHAYNTVRNTLATSSLHCLDQLCSRSDTSPSRSTPPTPPRWIVRWSLRLLLRRDLATLQTLLSIAMRVRAAIELFADGTLRHVRPRCHYDFSFVIRPLGAVDRQSPAESALATEVDTQESSKALLSSAATYFCPTHETYAWRYMRRFSCLAAQK